MAPAQHYDGDDTVPCSKPEVLQGGRDAQRSAGQYRTVFCHTSEDKEGGKEGAGEGECCDH